MGRSAVTSSFRSLAAIAFTLAFAGQAAAQVGFVRIPGAAGFSVRGGDLFGSAQWLGTGQPAAGVRMTLFTSDLAFFREVRTDAAGAYALPGTPPGVYRLGAALPGAEYAEVGVVIQPGVQQVDFVLEEEAHPGTWNVIGNTLPELFDATDIAALRPDGSILFCHDTVDPILFDPVTRAKVLPAGSGSEQGCMNTTYLQDGSILFVGGQTGASPGDFRNAIPWVKRFRPDNTWEQLGDMLAPTGRWYPGLARLNDGRILAFGGGTAPSAVRTDTSELFDPLTQTWSWTGSMGSANEFAPSALLYNGLVLRTWGAGPELFDPATASWSPAGPFVFGGRGFPGHSDHSLLVLTDGRALIVGALTNGVTTPPMSEYYDPVTDSWSAGTSPDLIRYQGEVVYLPNGEVFCGAGDQGTTAGPEPNVLGIVRRCDLFDPLTGDWRRVADMPTFREYHGVTLLIPDGRVVTTGGTHIKFQAGPTSADIEAYSPPYLFRGVRPVLDNLSDERPVRGQALSVDVFPATTLTSVVLMGMQTTTHWLDGGVPRRLELGVSQAGSTAQFVLPADADLLPVGWYLLFGMVDDIPSAAIVVRVDP